MWRHVSAAFGWVRSVLMATPGDPPSWLTEIDDNLGARTRISYRVPSPPFGVADPVAVSREANLWFDDARPFDPLRTRAWQQLHRDLTIAFEALGPELSREVRPTFDSNS